MAGKKKTSASVGTEKVEATAVTVPAKKKRGRPKGSKNKTASSKQKAGGKRGRKAIFTDEQKKVLDRMIRISLKSELRALVKAL